MTGCYILRKSVTISVKGRNALGVWTGSKVRPSPMPAPDMGPLFLYTDMLTLVAEDRCSDSHNFSSLLCQSVIALVGAVAQWVKHTGSSEY